MVKEQSVLVATGSNVNLIQVNDYVSASLRTLPIAGIKPSLVL